MMVVVSDNSNRNGGAAMGMGRSDRIASNLISRLLLVSVTLLLLGIRSWKKCVVLVCVPSNCVWTLRTVVLVCVTSLVWTLRNVVLLCVP